MYKRQRICTSWSSRKSQMRRCVHKLSSSSHQRVLSISLRTAHERGDARRRCYSIGAVLAMTLLYCIEYRVGLTTCCGSVSKDVSFHKYGRQLHRTGSPAPDCTVCTGARWRQVPQQVYYGRPPSRLSIITVRRGSTSYNCTIPCTEEASTTEFELL